MDLQGLYLEREKNYDPLILPATVAIAIPEQPGERTSAKSKKVGRLTPIPPALRERGGGEGAAGTSKVQTNKRGQTQKSPIRKSWWGFSIKFPAATYSPTQLPMQYHRP